MSQRNPMNERYQGEGPGGKTKKSAAKLKPKSQAASSVHVEAKPTNRQERKAAARRRQGEEKRKAEEHARKAAERERKEREAAGEPEEKKAPAIVRFFLKPHKSSATGSGGGQEKLPASAKAAAATPTPEKKSVFPASKEYKDLRKKYWILIAIGVAFVVAAFALQTNFSDHMEYWVPVMAGAYACIIGAVVLDFRKIRPLVREHQRVQNGGSGKKSPKQIKHEEEAAARAHQIESFNKAKKQAKRDKRRAAIGLAVKNNEDLSEAATEGEIKAEVEDKLQDEATIGEDSPQNEAMAEEGSLQCAVASGETEGQQ